MLFLDQIYWVLVENLGCMLSERQTGKEMQNWVSNMGKYMYLISGKHWGNIIWSGIPQFILPAHPQGSS